MFISVSAALVEYKSISNKTLQESIESEMSGDLEKLLVAIGKDSTVSSALFLFRETFKNVSKNIVFCAFPQ